MEEMVLMVGNFEVTIDIVNRIYFVEMLIFEIVV